MSSPSTQWIPVEFSYQRGISGQNKTIGIGYHLIKSVEITIGDHSYQSHPIEGCDYTIKGQLSVDWICGCGYRIIDPVHGLDPPNTCPMCGRDHSNN